MFLLRLAPLVTLLLWPTLLAALQPAALFTDHLVLQRDRPIPVWGTAAAPGAIVTVGFDGHTATATTDADGRWLVTLPARSAVSTSRDLTISSGSTSLTLNDVLVGEVWLASGQSNMAWTLAQTRDAALDAPASVGLTGVREFLVERRPSPAAVANITSTHGWRVAGPDTTPAFSAVAFYFARELHARLGVPVGIINSSWGGTRVEAWMSEATLAASEPGQRALTAQAEANAAWPALEPAHREAVAAWASARDAARDAGKAFSTRAPREPMGAPGQPNNTATLFQGMIHGLAPVALQGAIWYQGESNAGRADEYRELFGDMITNWRDHFVDPSLDFFWVQLTSFAAGGGERRNWAFLREAQTQTLDLPHTGQAVTYDLGDVRDIHPRNKLDVGRRLARLALHRTYGLPVPDEGPRFVGATRDGDAWMLAFAPETGRLITPQAVLGGFEVAGEDRDFHPAEATIEGDHTVRVHSPAVPAPVAVRYAWRNALDHAGLFNPAGLPATPFRTDDW
jgi:sialate O-acetylesterase